MVPIFWGPPCIYRASIASHGKIVAVFMLPMCCTDDDITDTKVSHYNLQQSLATQSSPDAHSATPVRRLSVSCTGCDAL